LSAEIEILNTERGRVDIAVHLDGQPPAHLVFLENKKGEIKGHPGKPLNEAGRNGFVPREIFLQARELAASRLALAPSGTIRKDEQMRLFD